MLSAELKRWRKRQKLTQEDLAEILECTTRSISRYENQDGAMPRYLEFAIRYLMSEGKITRDRMLAFRRYRKKVLGE